MNGTQLVKTLVSVYGYPVWVEVEVTKPDDVDLARRRVETVLKALAKDNQVRGPF